jgi:hypothetical protein
MSRGRSDDGGTAQPRNDAYTGMLAVSLVGLVIGCVLLFLDFSQYPGGNPPQPTKVQPFNPIAEDGAPGQKK